MEGRLSSEGLGGTLHSDRWREGSLAADPKTFPSARTVGMPRILHPRAGCGYWHGRYSAGAATDPRSWRGALAPRPTFRGRVPERDRLVQKCEVGRGATNRAFNPAPAQRWLRQDRHSCCGGGSGLWRPKGGGRLWLPGEARPCFCFTAGHSLDPSFAACRVVAVQLTPPGALPAGALHGFALCRLTFELRRPTRQDALAARCIIDNRRRAAKAACLGGSPLERGVRRHSRAQPPARLARAATVVWSCPPRFGDPCHAAHSAAKTHRRRRHGRYSAGASTDLTLWRGALAPRPGAYELARNAAAWRPFEGHATKNALPAFGMTLGWSSSASVVRRIDGSGVQEPH